MTRAMIIKIDDNNDNENDNYNKIMSICIEKWNENKSGNKELACDMKYSFRHMQFIMVTNDIN